MCGCGTIAKTKVLGPEWWSRMVKMGLDLYATREMLERLERAGKIPATMSVPHPVGTPPLRKPRKPCKKNSKRKGQRGSSSEKD